MRKLWLLVMGLSALALPSKASADELNLTGMGLRDIVSVNLLEPGFQNGAFYAGQFLWDWTPPTPDGFSTSIVTYCADILSDVQNPQQVVIDSTDNMPSLAQDGGGKAAWLVNTFAPLVTTGIEAAALQVAIWEALYDNVPDVTTGTFSIVTDDTAYTGAYEAQLIAAQATTYLTQLFYGANGEYYTSTATWLNTGSGQDQITTTPEPASLMLMGIGMTLAAARRRRDAAAHA